jgi:tetratricopeptide (TPR) repeat protein
MQETILSTVDDSKDPIETTLLNTSQNILVFVFGLLPLFFVPVPFISFDYAKTVIVMIGILLAIIFYSLSVLRSGKITLAAPLALWALWGVAAVTAISALFSGDMLDSFVGDDIGVHTSLFVIVLALLVTTSTLILRSKAAIMRLYILLTGSAVVLALFHVLRIAFGPGFLSLGVFGSQVSSPIGGWNDLALFFGLAILLSLVALEQLSLTKGGKILFSAVVATSLVMLAVINFVAVWVVLGLVSLIVLMYTLTKDRFSEKNLTLEGKKKVSAQSVILSAVVFITSLMFVIGGGVIGGAINRATDISYVEVRPSIGATVDIARNVFKDNAIVGVGPNKFVDAWRLYKDRSINDTIFWATDFNAGSSYVTTAFVNTGIVGVLAWLAFLGLFLVAGFRLLFKPTHVDRMWYFVGSSSFVAATYLWGMSTVYISGSATLLLAAIFTGIVFVTYSVLLQTKGFSLSIAANKRAGFILVGVIMVVIVGASSALYAVGRHYASVHAYGDALYGAQTGRDLTTVEQQIAEAYAIVQNDTYASQLASIQLGKMNALASLAELTDEQQQQLQSTVQNGINAGLTATAGDTTDSLHWSTLGSIYSVLAAANVEGAQDKAREAFGKARSFDPLNPVHILLEAQLASRTGDLAGARTKAQEAIALKPNYTDALFFLTQIDIAEGKTADAVATTQAIISLEPNNPARYYQLGVLQSANNNLDGAIAAFQRAVALDGNYANARYFLALAYAQKGDNEAALKELQVVLDLNPGNAEVTAIMDRIRSGQPLIDTTASQQVQEPQEVSAEDDAVTTTGDPDTSLISPVNTVPESEEDSQEEGE